MKNKELTLVKGDTGYNITFYLKKEDGTTYSIDNSTSVLLSLKNLLGKNNKETTYSVTITNPSGGECTFNLPVGFTLTPSLYQARVRVLKNGQVEHSNSFLIKIEE